MNYIFKFLIFMHTIYCVTLYGAAAKPKSTSEAETAIEAQLLSAHGPAVRAALGRTSITPVLYPIIFGYLESDQHKPRVTFPDVRYKYAMSSDGKGFYATNAANTLSHYCQNGTTTPLKRNFHPDGYTPELRSCPRKSWIRDHHLMAIVLFQRDKRDYHWHLSSTDLNPPHTTRFRQLDSEYRPGQAQSTPAAPLEAGLVVCDEASFALYNPSDLKVTREFTRPLEHSHAGTLKPINNNQFVGHFYPYNSYTRERGRSNHFYLYGAHQSAPLHSFSTDRVLPKVFPCHDQNTLIITDGSGNLLQVDHTGRTVKDFTPAWANLNSQANIHRLQDGSGFLAYSPTQIIKIDLATPDQSTPIACATMHQLHRLRRASPGQLLALYWKKFNDGEKLGIFDINTNKFTEVGHHNFVSRVRIMPEGFLVTTYNPMSQKDEVTFYSKKSLLELACQAPSTSAPKKPASSPAATLAATFSTLPSSLPLDRHSPASPATPPEGAAAAAARGATPASFPAGFGLFPGVAATWKKK